MQGNTRNASEVKQLHFKLLPAYAEHLLHHKLREFTKKSIDLALAVDFPILKFFDLGKYSEKELIDLSLPSYTQFFTAAINNKLSDFILEAVQKWETNQLPDISNQQLVIE